MKKRECALKMTFGRYCRHLACLNSPITKTGAVQNGVPCVAERCP